MIRCFIPITGVAYSRHIVQIYSYHGNEDVRQHLEVYLILNFLFEIYTLIFCGTYVSVLI